MKDIPHEYRPSPSEPSRMVDISPRRHLKRERKLNTSFLYKKTYNLNLIFVNLVIIYQPFQNGRYITLKGPEKRWEVKTFLNKKTFNLLFINLSKFLARVRIHSYTS